MPPFREAPLYLHHDYLIALRRPWHRMLVKVNLQAILLQRGVFEFVAN